MSIFNVILKLYLPIAVLIILLIIVLNSKKDGSGKFNLSLFGLYSTELPIKHSLLFKIISIVLFGFLTLVHYLLIDFTQFYPTKLKMTVHFDKKGIIGLYNNLGVKEVDGLPIDITDDTTRKRYIQKGDKTVFEKYKIKDFFTKAFIDSTATISTEGNTTFIVKKKDGLQNYFIEEASGELTHSLYEPKQSVKKVKTSFTKMVSANDKIEFNYIATTLGKRIIISPLFTENLLVSDKQGNQENVQLDHFLYGVTALRVSPFPRFSNTLYLYRAKNKLIPICYAIYIDD